MRERSEELEANLPNLLTEGYRITSDESEDYNCFAWAAGIDDKVIDPGAEPQVFWVRGIPLNGRIRDFVRLYELIGYQVCESAELESEYQKIALFSGEHEDATHAAIQLESGAWSSKCGEAEDIEHPSLTALEGAEYGMVSRVMRRRKGAARTLELVRMSELVKFGEWFR